MMKKFAFFALGSFLLLHGQAEALTFLVPGQFPKIQEAIKAASSGDTVTIKAGTYEESLKFKEGVILAGESRDKVIVQCDGGAGSVLLIEQCAKGKISQMTFRHVRGPAAQAAQGDGFNVVVINQSDVELDHCAFLDGTTNGIAVVAKCSPLLKDCEARGNRVHGLMAYGRPAAPRIVGGVFANNGRNGIYFSAEAGGSVENSTCSGNGSHGISVDNKNGVLKASGNTLTGNRKEAIYLEPGGKHEIQGNKESGNHIDTVSWDLGRLLAEKKFEELDQIAAKLLAEKRRYLSTEWQLEFYFRSLGRPSELGPALDPKAYPELMQAWLAARPQSAACRVTMAEEAINAGWSARGGGYAPEVTEAGWKGLAEHLKRARDLLSEAEKLDPKNPAIYSRMITVAMGSSASGKEIGGIFDKGVKAEPLYHPLYYARASTLLPRWGGKEGDLQRFAEEAVKITKDAEGDGFYARIAGEVAHTYGIEEIRKKDGLSWERIQRGFEEICNRYPKSDYEKNLYCWVATKFDDRASAAKCFEKIGYDWDSFVWSSRHQFDVWKKWAAGGEKPNSPALNNAVKYSKIEEARKILKDGKPKIDERDEDGFTSLQYAIAYGTVDMAKLLLDSGADMNLKDEFGYSPLALAIRRNKKEIAEFLRSRGAKE